MTPTSAPFGTGRRATRCAPAGRSQEDSKAVLELCENLFLHRARGSRARAVMGGNSRLGCTLINQRIKPFIALPKVMVRPLHGVARDELGCSSPPRWQRKICEAAQIERCSSFGENRSATFGIAAGGKAVNESLENAMHAVATSRCSAKDRRLRLKLRFKRRPCS